jgi:hypothetical protein
MVLSIVPSFSCASIKYEPTESGLGLPSLHLGIWRQRKTQMTAISGNGETQVYVYDTCQKYPDNVEIDSAWKASRAFSVMVPILGFFIVVALCVKGKDMSPAQWKGISLKMMIL